MARRWVNLVGMAPLLLLVVPQVVALVVWAQSSQSIQKTEAPGVIEFAKIL
ncbi:MAG: hypothetical protein HC916_18370 [Coleofasciculaceae cyanobacterium SM2_1_6]|nr:hypothetical protein [Coleofasciculaceae cyanobacterium SM2_1_6]